MLVEVLERWVTPPGVGSVCCDLHNLLPGVTKVIDEIRRRQCNAISIHRSDIQCPNCLTLITVRKKNGSTCAARICDVCEWEGSAQFDSDSGTNCRATL
eukprot:TRINITY_DN39971_c0_g1_i1.p1 TRINITY_DN39971_c0_g1~~TRINITY_DN39971_c0_g1_i1.p1  ORF type:complete len:107 (+),score=10.61 TRINITY_DN39971_c0_g1_i1:25-321(+)